MKGSPLPGQVGFTGPLQQWEWAGMDRRKGGRGWKGTFCMRGRGGPALY